MPSVSSMTHTLQPTTYLHCIVYWTHNGVVICAGKTDSHMQKGSKEGHFGMHTYSTSWYKMRCKLIEADHLWIHCMHALSNNTYTISYNIIHIKHHTMPYIYNGIQTIQPQ